MTTPPTSSNRPRRLRRSLTPHGGAGKRPARRSAEVAAFRALAQAYRRVPLWATLTSAALFVGLIAAITHTVNGDPSAVATSAGAAAALAAIVHLSLRRPDVTATLLALGLAITLAPPIAVAYASTGRGPADAPGAITTLVATYLLIALAAHRFSRGPAWVTTLLALTSLMFLGPFLLLLYPPLGFGWAWLTAITVLWARGGGIAWMRDLRHRFTRDYHAAAAADAAEEHRATARATTATLLDALPAGYTVFHGRRTPTIRMGRTRETHLVDHLVVGPTGLTIITSHSFKGRVIDDPDHGLTHDHTQPVDISGLLNDADTLASIVATRTKLGWLPVRQIVVIHDAVLPAKRSRVGLVAADGNTLGVLTVLRPDLLIDHITDTDHRVEHYLDHAQVAQAVARIDRLCPPHRTTSLHRARRPISLYRARMVVMDNDGNRRTPNPATQPREPLPMFATSNNPFDLYDGQQVCLLTDQGVFDGYHVAGEPITGDDGITRVPVLDETINLTDHRNTGADTLPLLWMPFDSIQPLSH